MYRPENWDEVRKRAITERGMLPPQTEFPIVIPQSLDWEILKGQLFEAGADAILTYLLSSGIISVDELEALREISKDAGCSNPINIEEGLPVYVPFLIQPPAKGRIVFIPDEE